MNQTLLRTTSFTSALVVTFLLFSLLFFVNSVFHTTLDTTDRYGSVRLSQMNDAPTEEKEELFTTDKTIEVPEMEEISEVNLEVETPLLQVAMPSMRFEFAPELAGSVPVGSVPSLADAGAAPMPSGGALTLGEVDELPRPIYAPAPMYPSNVTKKEEKTVIVRIVINADGSVSRATPLQKTAATEPFLDEALQSVLRWTFTPCKKEGRAVQCVAEQPFLFTPR